MKNEQSATKELSTAEPKPMSAAQKALQKLGLRRPIDYALHIPLRYEDETHITPLRDARPGEVLQIAATVTEAKVVFAPRRQLSVRVNDGSESCLLRFLNFYPSHQKSLTVGSRFLFRGELRSGRQGLEMVHPSFKPDGGVLPDQLTPIYSTVAGLPQAYIRKAVLGNLERADLSATLPPAMDAFLKWSLADALRFLHQPGADVSIAELEDRSHPAWQRLKAEELLAQQLSQQKARAERALKSAPALLSSHQQKAQQQTAQQQTAQQQKAQQQTAQQQTAQQQTAQLKSGLVTTGLDTQLEQQLLAMLPFSLTEAQQRVTEEIWQDLGHAKPMHRLLQGDVGSGKTVVAALAALRAIEAGYQCALMVPTEILAEQHFRKMVQWFEALGLQVAWLAGSQKKKEKTAMLDAVVSGAAHLIVGTHAVIAAQVQFAKLGLVIIDEQHRFGVEQRLALRAKMQNADKEPHLLMMSATPIPRTLAMSYYADLDVSTIDTLPPGRTPVLTKLVHEERKGELLVRIKAQINAGRQVYWVCPLIEESEALDLSNATETYAQLREALPEAMRVGLLHSRMPALEKQMVMELFVKGRIQLLVSTTVIEVGVDVPNASLMVIEHAERFGLSQLHQLRGRVGRGDAASACILLYSKGESGRLGDSAKQRLQAMIESNDGFEIARRDLAIRGPGEFLGARQSGQTLLRFADLNTDVQLLEWARQNASLLLAQHGEQAKRHIDRWLGDTSDYLSA